MELQPIRYKRVLEILPASEALPDPQPVAAYDYSEAEIQHLSIHSLNLWKNIGTINIPPHPLVIPSQIQENHRGIADIHVDKKPREQAIELAAKASYELSSLHSLTNMVIRSNNQLISPYYRAAKEEHINQLKLSLQQRVHHTRTLFSTPFSNISLGIKDTKSVLASRTMIIEKLAVFSKVWKLTSLPDFVKHYDNNVAAVDCSLAAFGDDSPSTRDYIVHIISDKDVILVNPIEKSRPVHTIQFSLIHSDFGEVCSTTAWSAQKPVSDAHQIERYSDVESVHQYCLRRQHDSTCSRLFDYLLSQAAENQSKYFLKPRQTKNAIYTKPMESLVIVEALSRERFFLNPEIWLIERGTLIFALSEKLSVKVSLIAIPETPTMKHGDPTIFPFETCLKRAYQSSHLLLLELFSRKQVHSVLPLKTDTSSSSSGFSNKPSNNNMPTVKPLDKQTYDKLRVFHSKDELRAILSELPILSSLMECVKVSVLAAIFTASAKRWVVIGEPSYRPPSYITDIMKRHLHFDDAETLEVITAHEIVFNVTDANSTAATVAVSSKGFTLRISDANNSFCREFVSYAPLEDYRYS